MTFGNHWDDLASQLGAEPGPQPAHETPPAQASAKPAAAPRTVAPPAPRPARAPTNWNALAGDLGLEIPPEPAPTPPTAPAAKAPAGPSPSPAETAPPAGTVAEISGKVETLEFGAATTGGESQPIAPAKPYRPSFSEPAYRPDPSVRQAAERRIGAAGQEKRRDERSPAPDRDRGRERYPNRETARDTRKLAADDLLPAESDLVSPQEIDETSHVLGVEAMLDEIVDVECVDEGEIGGPDSPGGRNEEAPAPRRRRRRRGGRNRRRPGDSRPPRAPSTDAGDQTPEEFDEGDTDLGFVRPDAETPDSLAEGSNASGARPLDAAGSWEAMREVDDDSTFEDSEDAERGHDGAERSDSDREISAGEEGSREPRRRRRRRSRGGKGRSSSRAPQAGPADAENSVERAAEGPEPVEIEPSDREEDEAHEQLHAHYDDEEGDEGANGFGKQSHKGFPTWEETVGMIIATNMESRAKSPKAGGPRGRGRGRGNPRGNNYRGGGSRPAGPGGGDV